LSPSEDIFVAWKVSNIEEWCKEETLCFRNDITETKVGNLKTALGLSLSEDVLFRDNYCLLFSDTYRMIRPVISFWAVNFVEKW
jgi:hypothetical protein